MTNLRTLRTPSRWMTTTATDGSGADAAAAATGGGADAAAPAAATTAAGGAADKPFYESFTDEALKTSPAVQRYKTPEELADAYVNLEKRFGVAPNRRIDLPADPNDKEGMRAVWTKLGLPDKPEGYGLKLDDKATDADKAMLGDFTVKAHELGLPPGQAKGVMDFWMAKAAEANAAAAEAETAAISTGKAALQKEFGTAFDARQREIAGLTEKYFGPKIAEALKGDGLFKHPDLAIGLGKLLDRMAEPGAAGGNAGDAAQGDRGMTPTQAKAAVSTLEGDPVKGKALRERDHPQHAAVLAERNRLLALANPPQQQA